MILDPKDLFSASIALSVYISAIRLYAETRRANGSANEQLVVLLFLVSIPDFFFVLTVIALLLNVLTSYEALIDYAGMSFGFGVLLLIFLHMVEWRRNLYRIYNLNDPCAALQKYFKRELKETAE